MLIFSSNFVVGTILMLTRRETFRSIIESTFSPAIMRWAVCIPSAAYLFRSVKSGFSCFFVRSEI